MKMRSLEISDFRCSNRAAYAGAISALFVSAAPLKPVTGSFHFGVLGHLSALK
jgi:hypothetical protein